MGSRDIKTAKIEEIREISSRALAECKETDCSSTRVICISVAALARIAMLAKS